MRTDGIELECGKVELGKKRGREAEEELEDEIEDTW